MCLICDSGPISITVSRARCSISMGLSQPNKFQLFTVIPTKIALLTAPEREKELLEVTDAVDYMERSEDAE